MPDYARAETIKRGAEVGERNDAEMAAAVSPDSVAMTYEERLLLISELADGYAYTLTSFPSGEVLVDWVTPNLARCFHVVAGTRLRADAWQSFVPPDDHLGVGEWLQLLAGGLAGSREHRAITSEGDAVWLHHSIHVTPSKDSTRIDGAAMDITERKLAVQALERSEERFRTMTDQISNLVVEVDEKGRVVFVNHAIQEMLGWSAELLMSSRLMPGGESRGWVHPDDLAQAEQHHREGFMSADPQEKGRSRFRHFDGSWRWLELAAATYRTPDGLHRVLIGRDVTDQVDRERADRRHAERLAAEVQQRTEELRQAYEQLRALQSQSVDEGKLETAKELAGKVAHAINNPLAALLGRVQMERESSRPSREGLLHIRHLAERIQSVVSNTLTLYREGRLRLEYAHPIELLQDVRGELEQRAKASDVELRIDVTDDVPQLLVDRALLTAALVSVAENGLDAMPDGGALDLEAVHLKDVEVVQFRIGDRGHGIPPNIVPRIFEPFFTTKASGTGLGLPIANGVVKGHRGHIEVSPRTSGGTWFAVNIPYAETGRVRLG